MKSFQTSGMSFCVDIGRFFGHSSTSAAESGLPIFGVGFSASGYCHFVFLGKLCSSFLSLCLTLILAVLELKLKWRFSFSLV